MNNKNVGSGYRQEPGYGRIVDGKIYIGIVKNNQDAMKMGRLEVWIPEMGGEPDNKGNWHIVSYASPFAGATSINDTVENSQTMDGTQKSYGWWAVPPDLENQVLCCFVNGDASKGFWFACLWQQNMNHMVPGVASNASFQEGEQGILPPVVEYNKDQSSPNNIDPQAPRRARFDPLHDGLTAQGLYTDFERGPSDASARREAPSRAFGMLTPRSNQLYIDDDPENEYIRMRTRSGVQVLIHETNGYVYINSGKGNSWVEISDLGVDIYTKNSLSIRTELDLNIRSDRDVNIDAGRNINFKAGGNIKTQAGGFIHSRATGDIRFTTDANLHLKSAGNTASSAGGSHSTKASSIYRDGQIKDNSGSSSDAGSAQAVDVRNQVDYKGGSKSTPVSRMPHHEPWAGHPKVKDQEMPRGDLHNIPPAGTGSQPKPFEPGPTTTVPPTKEQRTGDGTTKSVPYDTTKNGSTQVGTKNVPSNVEAAIAKGASVSGINYGYMMAMADQESSFNPNAKAPTSSASGLYQFTDSTWGDMVKKYGSQTGITAADKTDPEAQAIMAGLYAKENAKVIARATGKAADQVTNTELYMGHFLGGGGASKFLTADGDATAATIAGAKSAAANRNVFYKNGDLSQPRTVNEVKQFFANKIEPKSTAYAANQPSRD